MATFATSQHEFSGPFVLFEGEWWVVDLKIGIVSLHPSTFAVTTRISLSSPNSLTGFDILKAQRVVVFSRSGGESGLYRFNLDSSEQTLLESWVQADSYFGALLDQVCSLFFDTIVVFIHDSLQSV